MQFVSDAVASHGFIGGGVTLGTRLELRLHGVSEEAEQVVAVTENLKAK